MDGVIEGVGDTLALFDACGRVLAERFHKSATDDPPPNSFSSVAESSRANPLPYPCTAEPAKLYDGCILLELIVP